MGTFTNSKDPDEMPHNVAFYQVYTVCKVEKLSRQKCNLVSNLLPDTPIYIQLTIRSLFIKPEGIIH